MTPNSTVRCSSLKLIVSHGSENISLAPFMMGQLWKAGMLATMYTSDFLMVIGIFIK